MDAVLGHFGKLPKGFKFYRQVFGTNKAYIYILFCPDTKEPRYVGCCHNPRQRRQQHSRVYDKPATPVQRWVTKLAKAGKKPTFVIASVVNCRHINRNRGGHVISSVDAGRSVEGLLINSLSRMGCDLLNVEKPKFYKAS